MGAVEVATNYARGVLDGTIPACSHMLGTCQRYFDDLDREDIYLDAREANRAVSVARLMRHWKGGKFSGKRFEPEPWQVFIIVNVIAWKDSDSDLRRFRECYIEVPRKNGKTFLASFFCLYLFAFDEEPGSEVFSVATKLEQAKIVWKDFCNVTKKDKQLSSLFQHRFDRTYTADKTGVFRPLASDPSKLDGFNPHLTVNDELHAWTDSELYYVIQEGMGARSQPLIFSITTAGWDQNGICYKLREYGIRVIEKKSRADKLFIYIATIDEEDIKRIHDDPAALLDETLWEKANPNLGTSKSYEYMREHAERAVDMPTKRVQFLNKQLNVWTQSSEIWIPQHKWSALPRDVRIEEMSDRPCYIGLDLSTNIDITAVAFLWPPEDDGGQWACAMRYYLPKDNIQQLAKGHYCPYQQWADDGHLVLTDGDLIDTERVLRDVLRLSGGLHIREVGYDPWGAVRIATQLNDAGLSVIVVNQGFASISPATNEFEKLVMGGKLSLDGNPITDWMAGNLVVKQDSGGRIRPDKKLARNKIDGPVAIITALARAILSIDRKSIYETRGVR